MVPVRRRRGRDLRHRPAAAAEGLTFTAARRTCALGTAPLIARRHALYQHPWERARPRFRAGDARRPAPATAGSTCPTPGRACPRTRSPRCAGLSYVDTAVAVMLPFVGERADPTTSCAISAPRPMAASPMSRSRRSSSSTSATGCSSCSTGRRSRSRTSRSSCSACCSSSSWPARDQQSDHRRRDLGRHRLGGDRRARRPRQASTSSCSTPRAACPTSSAGR